MMYYPHMYHSPFGFFGPILNFVFWVLVIIFIVKLIRRKRIGNWHGFMSRGGAIETLRERFAKGEIDKAEYEERKKVLLEDNK